MRSFRRPNVTPPTLAAKIPPLARPASFPGDWTKPDVRGALLAMQGRICGYCGADVSENATDVEHFRPKSNVAENPGHGGYWWLAYDFRNYILSCTACNQKRKGDRYPVTDGGAHVGFADRNSLHQEPRVLLDPAVDPLEDWVRIDITDVDLLPLRPAAKAPDPKRIQQAVDFFGLNERVAQCRRRLLLLEKAANAIAAGRAGDLTDEAIRFRPQSLIVWQLLRANAPAALPDDKREQDWLLSQLCADLIKKLAMLKRRTTKLDERERDELLWAIATLWKDPPSKDPADIANYFSTRKAWPEIPEIETLVKKKLLKYP